MIGAVSGWNSYFQYSYIPHNQSAVQNAQKGAQNVQGSVWASRQTPSLEMPVQPVRPVTAVNPNASSAGLGIPIRLGADPAEMAVRMRIRYVGGQDESPELGADGVQKAAEEGECQTCKERKYQDGSDDPGVSFKTPTNIDPSQAAAKVRGHEMEHVNREQAKAQREGRKVVSQSVTYHTAICPECGRVYVSGGTTTTKTKAIEEPPAPDQQQKEGRGSVSA